MTFVKSVSRAISGPLSTGIQGSGEPPVPAIPVIALTSISGDTLVSSVLTSTVVFSQGYPAPTITYQWQRNAVNISGATSDTYTLVAADAGAAITLDVQATNSEGSDTDTSNTINASALAVPVISGVPTISGTADVGEVLTATAASVTGNPPPSTTWQWERDGTPIGGATSSTYTVVLADENTAITVVQTETNTQGSDTAESAATTITAAPSISGVPTLSGTETVGQTLTATAASVTGTPTPTRSFQWQRSSDGSTGWADISGATSSTYELVSADEDNYVRAVQTETNTEGTDTANSAASGQISGTASLPLDSVTAIGAWSVSRKLRTAYSGSCIRVRRSSDDAEQDIGFSGTSLDESALTTFVGANDGFITKIYEQSGDADAEDYAQSTNSAQPQIVSSGTVVKKGGYVAMNQPASSDFVTLATWAEDPNNPTIIEVWSSPSSRNCVPVSASFNSVHFSGVAENGSSSTDLADSVGAGTPVYYVDGTLVATEGTDSRDDFHTAACTDAIQIVRHDGIDLSAGTWDTLRTTYNDGSNASFPGPEYWCEQIILQAPSAQDVSDIESDQASFYGITL